MFSWEFSQIFQNSYFKEHAWTSVSEIIWELSSVFFPADAVIHRNLNKIFKEFSYRVFVK